jgi:hypothetical protein
MDVFDAVFCWLEIREANGISLTDALQLKIDAQHSSLLPRIIAGEDVFPEPPPRSFSYPWVELIKTGRALPFEVSQGPGLLAGPDALVIDQSDEWRILERLGEDQFIATYRIPDRKAIAELRAKRKLAEVDELPMRLSDSRWKVFVQGPMENIPDRQQWVVERLQ